MKKIVKRALLKRRGILIDAHSVINYGVKLKDGFQKAVVRDSILQIASMGDGCFFEHVTAYGNIECGRYVSISGPGTILHSEGGRIIIGSFTSIAQNVSIQQFNHNTKRPTTYGMQYHFFGNHFVEDAVVKGDVVIGEDVWIGSNAVICSGVHIGRGAVVGAGAVVTKDILPYTINAGVPSRIIRKRFTEGQIAFLEEKKWWLWSKEKIKRNKEFFISEVDDLMR